jgi:hypothetical protein
MNAPILENQTALYSERQIVDLIRRYEPFHATLDDGSFSVAISRYVPMVCTAIHDGHRVREMYKNALLVTDEERLFEEDPHTGEIARNFAISLIVHDSRYTGDLNRTPEACIYDEAWGKKVWRRPLSDVERNGLLAHHGSYYRIVTELLTALVKRFGNFVFVDLHSYNYARIAGSPPLFNMGSHYIDTMRYGELLDHLLVKMADIKLPGIENRTVCNEVFRGRGYQAEFVHLNFPGNLCYPLEIKKVFMDERALVANHEVMEPMIRGLTETFAENGALFSERINGMQVSINDFYH